MSFASRALRSLVPAFCGRNMSMVATTRFAVAPMPAVAFPAMLPARFSFCTEAVVTPEAPPASTEVKLYVGNLPWDVDDSSLRALFNEHNPAHCNVVRRSEDGLSRGFGFVEFSSQEDADAARVALDGFEVSGRGLKVSVKDDTPRKPREDRQFADSNSKLYVGNLTWEIDNSRLEELCREHGEVKSCNIIMDRETGVSRGFAFVTFASAEEAEAAREALDQMELEGRSLKVNLANKGGAAGKRQRVHVISNSKLYVGNLSWGMEEADLTDLCSKFGEVSHTRIVTDRESGLSRGFGFVSMSSDEAAREVIAALNNTDVDGRVLTVGIAGEGK